MKRSSHSKQNWAASNCTSSHLSLTWKPSYTCLSTTWLKANHSLRRWTRSLSLQRMRCGLRKNLTRNCVRRSREWRWNSPNRLGLKTSTSVWDRNFKSKVINWKVWSRILNLWSVKYSLLKKLSISISHLPTVYWKTSTKRLVNNSQQTSRITSN